MVQRSLSLMARLQEPRLNLASDDVYVGGDEGLRLSPMQRAATS
ncbi:hypothetical protein OK016_19260 [Vibrio chagasii]|nr:hypothetical protein [Vibrio chagasii]